MIENSAAPFVSRLKRTPLVKNLRVGFCACRLQVKRLREYALGFWSSLASVPILMVVTFFVWRTVFGNRTAVNGYSFQEVLSYYFLLHLVSFVINQASAVAWEMWQDINSGNLGSYLARPLDYALLNLGKCAGPALVYLMAGILTYSAAATALKLPVVLTPVRTAFFGASVASGFLIVYLTQFIIAEAAFWLGRIDTLRDLLFEVYALFSGSIIPNDFLPPVLRNVAGALPFRFMYYIPVSALMGRLRVEEFPGLFINESLWVAGMVILSRLLWRRGVRRFEAQGG